MILKKTVIKLQACIYNHQALIMQVILRTSTNHLIEVLTIPKFNVRHPEVIVWAGQAFVLTGLPGRYSAAEYKEAFSFFAD